MLSARTFRERLRTRTDGSVRRPPASRIVVRKHRKRKRAGARLDFAAPFYLDGAVRLGKVSTELDGTYSATTAKYDADGLYATAHVGAGYVFDLAPSVKLDAYGRYLFSYVEGDDVTLQSAAREGFSMDDMTAHAVRFGARLKGAYEAFDWYAGLAYEHVFDGKAEGELKFGGATGSVNVLYTF